MPPRSLALTAALLLAPAALATPARADEGESPDPQVFEQAWRLVREHFYDRGLHGVDWEAARDRHLPAARRARSPAELHQAITALLGELGASHAAIMEREVYRSQVDAEAKAIPVPRYGLSLVRLEPGFFVSEVLAGSVAEAGGVRRGDRVVAIDGAPPEPARLTPAPYEAGLGGPRSYLLLPDAAGDAVELVLERRPNAPLGTLTVTLHAALWSQVEACRVSRRVVERWGLRIGYMRLYHLLIEDPVDMLEELIGGEARDADALVLDLRGRGGIPRAAKRLLAMFDPNARGGPLWGRPVVALIDAGTRSVKELLAFQWRARGIGPLVGERTHGAVLGATFTELRDGARLMLPVMDMRAQTGGQVLEGKGVAPDVAVQAPLPWSAGRDPIYERGLEVAAELALIARRRGKRHGWR